jgi:Xaa-Pro aminopeptidase
MTNAPYQDRLAALRLTFEAEGVDGFIIPRADEYQGEYVPDCADRLRWICGFTGSAGYAIVLKDRAGVFSDGRYTIQLKQQIDPALFVTGDSTKQSAGEWLIATVPDAVIGYDPRLHTTRDIRALEEKGVKVKPVSRNLIDVVWSDRPDAPSSNVEIFPLEYAGLSAREKLDQVAGILKARGIDAALITLPDSIAWLLNVRANDIPHIPVPLSTAIVYADATIDWFIDEARVGSDVRASFGNRVSLIEPKELERSIERLKSKKILIDERRAGQWFIDVLNAGNVENVDLKDPCIALKAKKNEVEKASMRNAHIRDGVAITKFLCWFDRNGAGTTEIEVEQKLAAFRNESPLCRDSSFDTIAGFGANGAIVHYRASPETNKTIEKGNLLLLDSGAQYADGTTDITRTIAVGTPSEDMKRHFTLVLKGHIALASARFPAGTTGAQVDVFARTPLWQAGLDYAHGTGHGVGVYLSVHEESASISPRGFDALEEGMILSNEPGYYLEGEYGIRIENLVLVKKDGVCADTGKDMLSFETLTLAPMDPVLVDFDLLTSPEKEWLKAYHIEVERKISLHLQGDEKAFLRRIVEIFAKA